MTRHRQTSQLTLKDVAKGYEGHIVLDRVSLTIRTGEKVGVIGENGSGKSTLLRLISGAEEPDAGEVTVAAPGGVGHLGQTLGLAPDLTVSDAVDHALGDLRDLERRMREAEASLADASPDELAAYGDLLAAYEARGGYEADARVEAALHGLGLGHIALDRPLGGLSGGEQSRLGLACVLAAAPELLLLDEPTNHLDERAVTWLEERLRAHRGTVVTVTHDRAFLDGFATAILEVDRDRHSVVRYGDGWDGYLAGKAVARRRWEQEYADWLAEIERQTELAESNAARLSAIGPVAREQRVTGHRRSHEGGVSALIRNARERLQRLRDAPVPRPPDPLRFAARIEGGKGDGLTAELAAVRVAGRLDIETFTLAPGERTLLTGPNGAGKTTFLRVLAGDLAQDHGKVKRPKRIGYLRQELPAERSRGSVLAAFAEGLPGPPDDHADALLALGLFRERDLRRPVTVLSVGQRRRLELARLVTRPADLLILDEPTNHLSLSLIEELEAALDSYRGSLLVVSHDRRFRSGFTGTRAELRDGRLVGAA
ncbi:ribosomal protection-like ABC-F family protein [Actinomadura xylanilytica]|uniref:ribosomal protection-like ABC-F family protein n=1 Tax=Actinomadura xylanilytica TaxID=887459 RepID=UPI00255AB31F|nr:ABC-F family ATP-binding cassette domain-containing protein [Actinomadura xylanilytica]MDL4773134.1 ABC-F family ATP-binding cassette domain-containing protein [Actinomadura xylanilytica]